MLRRKRKQLKKRIIKRIPSAVRSSASQAQSAVPNSQKFISGRLPLNPMISQFIPQYIPPQQQQVQNLKSTNDLKEQIINQARQDLLSEQERKKELLNTERQFKRDHSELKNKTNEEKQMIELEDRIRNLNFKKQQNENDSIINRKKIEHDAQLAMVEQLKKENEQLRFDNQHNILKNETESAVRTVDKLKLENEALQRLISAEQMNIYKTQYASAINNIAEEKIKTQFMQKFSDQWNDVIAKQMENSILYSEEETKNMIDGYKDEIASLQQTKYQIEKDQSDKKLLCKRSQLAKKMRDDMTLDVDKINLHNQELLVDTNAEYESEKAKLNDLVKDKVKSEFKNDILQSEKAILKESRKLEQQQMNNERQIEFLNSDENREASARLATMISYQNALNAGIKSNELLVEKQDEILKLSAQKELTGLLAIISDDDKVEFLQNVHNDPTLNGTYEWSIPMAHHIKIEAINAASNIMDS